MSSEIWKFVVTDKDIVTNGLDLLSFLFITPEVLRFLGPGMRKVALNSFLWCGALFPTILFSIFFTNLGNYLPDRWTWAKPIVILTIPAAGFAIGYFFLDPIVVNIKARLNDFVWWTTKHAFFVGVLLFLISRMVAFLGALLTL
jgi:hypothetical protein